MYVRIVTAADALLSGNLYWTERLLLRFVRHLYTRRLQQFVLAVDNDAVDEVLTSAPE